MTSKINAFPLSEPLDTMLSSRLCRQLQTMARAWTTINGIVQMNAHDSKHLLQLWENKDMVPTSTYETEQKHEDIHPHHHKPSPIADSMQKNILHPPPGRIPHHHCRLWRLVFPPNPVRRQQRALILTASCKTQSFHRPCQHPRHLHAPLFCAPRSRHHDDAVL